MDGWNWTKSPGLKLRGREYISYNFASLTVSSFAFAISALVIIDNLDDDDDDEDDKEEEVDGGGEEEEGIIFYFLLIKKST